MAQREALYGEIQYRLIQLGLSAELRDSVMALVTANGSEPSESHFRVQIARTFYRTALRATQALDTASLSMLIMLFDLFVAYEQQRTVSVSSLCIASGAAPTTALRQISQLEARGYVERREDAQDRRRSWVCPTPRAIELIGGLVEQWGAVLCA